MNDHQPASQDTGETRETWERPRLIRLATQSTLSMPGGGPDGGTSFNQEVS